MKSLRFIFFITVLLLFSFTASAAGESCKLLGDNLYNCKPFQCETKSSGGSVVKSRIIGLNSSGECVHEQSTPNGEKVLCRYSDESRKFLALRIKKYQTDLASLPQGSEFEESILADIFHNECDVSSPSVGDDKPVVKEDESAESLDDDYNEDEGGESSSGPEDSEQPSEEEIEDNGDLTEGVQ